MDTSNKEKVEFLVSVVNIETLYLSIYQIDPKVDYNNNEIKSKKKKQKLQSKQIVNLMN
jgi:hypothetical protein